MEAERSGRRKLVKAASLWDMVTSIREVLGLDPIPRGRGSKPGARRKAKRRVKR